MDFTILTNSIAEVVVVVLGIVITRYLVPWLKEKYSAERVSNVYDLISKAVSAAEKLYAESGSGVLKKQYVIDYVKTLGITITEADLNMFIESAVKVLDVLETEIKK